MSEYQVYAKLQKARIKLQQSSIKKSGWNGFAKYAYFELKDFLPEINSIFHELGLCSVISFDKELATLRIVDTDNGGCITFTSPMVQANMKGNHDIQNLGAVETYSRRYLYVTALELVEHDLLDAIKDIDAEEKASSKSISRDEFDKLSKEDQELVCSYAMKTASYIKGDDASEAVLYLKELDLEPNWKAALWCQLNSKQRSAIDKLTKKR